MKSQFSVSWVGSVQPRKQRKYRHNAPLHLRHGMLAAHLHKSLRKEFGTRAMPVRKGDEVEIMRGEFKGRRGAVSHVDTKKLKVYIENIKRKKVSGQEMQVPVDPSNLMITKLEMEDKERKKIFSRIRAKEPQARPAGKA